MAANSSFIVAFLKHPVSSSFLRLGLNIVAIDYVCVKLKLSKTKQPYVVTVLLKYFLVVPHTDIRGK